jgi:hypothetical protein
VLLREHLCDGTQPALRAAHSRRVETVIDERDPHRREICTGARCAGLTTAVDHEAYIAGYPRQPSYRSELTTSLKPREAYRPEELLDALSAVASGRTQPG